MIPVFEPEIGEEEIAAVADGPAARRDSGSFGERSRSSRGFADYCGCQHGVAVTSGTTALHLAVAAGHRPGR